MIKKILHALFTDKNLSGLDKLNLKHSISVLDIGARWGLGHPWAGVNPKIVNAILVEPDPEEAKLLLKNEQNTVLPYALWNKQETITLNINKSPGTSSILKDNQAFLSQFADSERFVAEQKITLKANTIDNLANTKQLPSIDFAKIDVQGAELAILQGGQQYFKDNLVGLESEVEFCPMYQNQPLFSELEVFVRQELGLELWDIRKTYWKYNQKHYKTPTKGRLIFGDALFLRPIDKLDDWLSDMTQTTANEKFNVLLITTLAYGYLDYTHTLLNAKFSNKYITHELKQKFEQYLHKLQKGFYPFKNGSSLLYQPLQILANCFKPTYQGWASSDAGQHLGSRKKGCFWF